MMEAGRDWRYARRVRRDFKFRAPIAASTATFTDSGNILTKTGAFADYTFVPGDYVTLTLNGTDAGSFRIASKTDSDNIVLGTDADSIGADYTSTVTVDLNTSRVQLPAEIGRIVTCYGNINTNTQPMALQEMSLLEAESLSTTALTVFYTLGWESVAGAAPAKVLSIWPEQQSAKVNALTIMFQRETPTLDSSETVLDIPPFVEPLLLVYAKQLARSWDQGVDEGAVLSTIRQGEVFLMAAREDARSTQHTHGVRNTAINLLSRRGPRPGYTYFPSLGN